LAQRIPYRRPVAQMEESSLKSDRQLSGVAHGSSRGEWECCMGMPAFFIEETLTGHWWRRCMIFLSLQAHEGP